MPLSQWFSQPNLLAQNGGEWPNIFFIVVLAVFWGIGAIVKAASAKNKRDQQQGGRGDQKRKPHAWIQQLVEKAEEIQRAVEGQQQQQKKQPQRPRPTQKQAPASPPQGQVAVRTGRGGQSVLVYEPNKRPQSSAKPPAQPPPRPRPSHPVRPAPAPRQQCPQKPQPAVGRPLPVSSKATQPAARTVEPRHRTPARVEPPTLMPTAPVASGVIDRNDPEALRRAILHAEILGKPLALRDSFACNVF